MSATTGEAPVERNNTRLRFEQWARNPGCDSNATSAILDVPMTEVAKREDLPPTMGQSPFALARGQQFERDLFRNDAERLRDALAEAGIAVPASGKFRDLRLRLNGGPIPNLREARDATADVLRAAARGSRDVPAIVAGATFRLPGRQPMLPEAILALDVLLIVGEGTRRLVVGEVKTYPDRGGYTDRGELATARAQAGVYVHALGEFRADSGLGDALEISEQGFLVLSRPGSNFPRVRPGEDLRYQAQRARQGMERLRERASELAKSLVAINDPVSAVLKAPCRYAASCVAFCDRAPRCFRRALSDGDPAVLGEDVKRFLGDVSLSRAVRLLSGEKPRNESERSVLVRIAEVRTGSTA